MTEKGYAIVQWPEDCPPWVMSYRFESIEKAERRIEKIRTHWSSNPPKFSITEVPEGAK